MINLKGRSFLRLLDFNSAEINYLLNLSARLKQDKYQKKENQYLKGKNIVLIFEKTSTRTRCAFEVAALDQGAGVTYLDPAGSQIGHKETMKDTARVLGRMYDGIEYRGFGQEIVMELARFAGVPVWNGLTNEYHPTQVLADLLTIREHSQKSFDKVKLCYMGDARYNMGNSLMAGAAVTGMDFRIAAPSQFFPSADLIKKCRETAAMTGASLTFTENVAEAVNGVDFLYTDVWVSMGEDETVWADRIKQLLPYQVNKRTVELSANPNVKFLHCLPAFHNADTKIGQKIKKNFGIEAMEVSDEVFESHHSIVFDQAENRMHTIKAVMVATIIDNSELSL